MRLSHGLQLAYCTNVHRGESWDQTFAALQRDTLAVRDRVGAGHPYAIGLRLGNDAARQLASPATLQGFRTWLDQENCYVFTINGFPYGQFHGTRVKERVYTPDWTTPERLAYTCLLFDLLAELVPNSIEGSISTVPVSFKGFHLSASARAESRRNLWRCLDHIETTTKRSGKRLHLGLEPEPLCTLETTAETVLYFDELRSERPGDPRLDQFLGVNYDCCHLAVEFEDPSAAIQRLRSAGIFLSKIHLSNALRVQPSAEVLTALQSFVDTVYFHQVIARDARTGALTRYEDLDQALVAVPDPGASSDEWRIHFHIPLHANPDSRFQTTADHLLGILDLLRDTPQLCSHLEMETYTWEVMPPEFKNRSVVDQLVSEYEWTLNALQQRGIHRLR